MPNRISKYLRRLWLKRKENRSDRQKYQYRRRQEADVHGVAASIERLGENIGAYAEQTHGHNKDYRRWHIAEVFALIVAAAVGAWAVVQSGWDSADTREVMRATLDEMKAEHRPWISIRAAPVKDSLRLVNGAPFVDLRVTIRNTGDQPGLGDQPIAFIYPYPFTIRGISIAHPADIYDDICPRAFTQIGGGYGYDVFPGDQIPGPGSEDMPQVSAPRAPGLDHTGGWPSETEWEQFTAYVVVCNRYMSSTKDDHITVAVYKLGKTGGGRSFFEFEGSFAN